jgi:hypothetical protein
MRYDLNKITGALDEALHALIDDTLNDGFLDLCKRANLTPREMVIARRALGVAAVDVSADKLSDLSGTRMVSYTEAKK